MPALKNYPKSIFAGKRFIAAALAAMAVCGMLSTAVAQLSPQTPQEKKAILWGQAMKAFGAGDYSTAATDFEAIIPLSTPDDNLEGIYFYLGASYFNTKEYDKAITTFKTFQTKYPKSQRIAEVLYSIAQAEMLSNNWADAITYFKMVEDIPDYHETALYYEGIAYKSDQKPDDAIAILEKLVLPEIHSGKSADGAVLLVELYARKKDISKASDMIKQIRKKMIYVDDLMTLNHQAIALGDQCVEDELYEEGLLCYRMVRTKDEVIQFQTDKLKAMAQQMAANNVLMQQGGAQNLRLATLNNALRAQIIKGAKSLEDYKNQPDLMPGVFLRIGQAFYKQHRQWESIVAFDEVIDKYPDAPEAEMALFSATVSSAEAIRPAATKVYAEEYIKKYPTGKFRPGVNFLVGFAAAQAEDWQAVVDAFTKGLADNPDPRFKEEMEMQLGNAYFSLGKFDDAAKAYTQYKTDYPDGVHSEEAKYRYALTFIFNGKYEDAMTNLNAYVTEFQGKPAPAGAFLSDAKYRLDMCFYAANQFQKVIDDCRQWEHDYPKDPLLAEVLALLADSLDATDKEDEAVQVYIRSAELATRDEGREYALDSAEKILQKTGDWDKIGQMYQEFMKAHPDSTLAPKAAYFIARANMHNGKIAEAKQFIADTILKYIDDPRRDAVEQLLIQLATACVHKQKPTPSPSPATAVAASGTGGAATSGTAGAVAAATPVPTPSPSASPAVSDDPEAEIGMLLHVADLKTPTAKARVLFTKAQLAGLRSQPAERDKNYQAIADQFQPQDLSSMILAFVGDYLLTKGQDDKAKPYFDYLLDEFPKSDVLDFAYNGLAQIAYDKNDYDKAIQYYNDAIDKGFASAKLKELTVGRARTLLQLKRYDLALKGFLDVAGVREWRGPLTAESIYNAGMIEQLQGKYDDAIAYYQRVYVAYQRYPQWVAKAYLQSGICFEKLGKNQEAIRTYQEMLSSEKIMAAKPPEIDEAKKHLQALGGSLVPPPPVSTVVPESK